MAEYGVGFVILINAERERVVLVVERIRRVPTWGENCWRLWPVERAGIIGAIVSFGIRFDRLLPYMMSIGALTLNKHFALSRYIPNHEFSESRFCLNIHIGFDTEDYWLVSKQQCLYHFGENIIICNL